MKKFIIYISFFGTLSVGSCKKILDVDPVEFTSDDITIVDENSARTAVRGVYNQLASNGYYGYTFQTLGFFSGDNIQYVGSQTVNNQLTNHDVKADLGALSTAWTAIYNTINRANHVIEKVPGLAATPTLTQAVKDQLVGEAYFIRALSYFDLARTWGGVQLVLVPTKSASDRPIIPRSTQVATYNQVLSDLETAESLLPQTTNRIRATKKTVWALRSRFHLYRQEWALAEEYATKLIDDAANYALVQPYQNFFANNSSNTSESVLELYYSTAVTNNQASQWLPTTKGGVGWIRPSIQVVELLNDPAKGGNRNSLLQKVVLAGVDNWFGNLYHRADRTDPAFLIRFAEVILNRAEARANQDKLETALTDLNKVRIRAGIQPIEGETDKNNVLLAIENERRLEFAFENHRWYDLVRTNRAQAVLGITDPNKLLLPIPFRELLVDDQLQQNPGYGE